MSYLLAILLWFIFGLIHSILARPFFKNKVAVVFGYSFKNYFYPSIYFVSQCIFFSFIYNLICNLEYGKVIFQITENYKTFYFIIGILSNLFLICSVLQFNISEFTGTRQILEYFKLVKKRNNEQLNQKYLYKYIRHPMYLGIILVYITSHTIFTELFFVNLLCIIFYIEIGSYFEEKTLLKKFGNKYKIYKKNTYKYLPFVK